MSSVSTPGKAQHFLPTELSSQACHQSTRQVLISCGLVVNNEVKRLSFISSLLALSLSTLTPHIIRKENNSALFKPTPRDYFPYNECMFVLHCPSSSLLLPVFPVVQALPDHPKSSCYCSRCDILFSPSCGKLYSLHCKGRNVLKLIYLLTQHRSCKAIVNPRVALTSDIPDATFLNFIKSELSQ